jgi:hypothetical protein
MLRCVARARKEAEFTTFLVVSWPMDLAEGELWVTEGPPCTAATERFDLGSLIALAA